MRLSRCGCWRVCWLARCFCDWQGRRKICGIPRMPGESISLTPSPEGNDCEKAGGGVRSLRAERGGEGTTAQRQRVFRLLLRACHRDDSGAPARPGGHCELGQQRPEWVERIGGAEVSAADWPGGRFQRP